MTKTNEFRVKESGGVFSVQRKCIGEPGCEIIGNYPVIKNWHTYYLGSTMQNETPFVYANFKEEGDLKSAKILKFNSLESAKQFITDELKAESNPIEGVVYHSYP